MISKLNNLDFDTALTAAQIATYTRKLARSKKVAIVVLPQSVDLCIPGTMGFELAEDYQIDGVVEHCSVRLSRLFGGSTDLSVVNRPEIFEGFGRWIDDSATLISEPVKLIHCYASQISKADLISLFNLALYVKDKMKQQSVLYAVNGVGYLV